MALLVLDRLAEQRPERGQIVVVRAGVVLPTMHEHDKDDVLSRCGIVWRQRFEPLRDAVHLRAVVASPLIVKLHDGELVRRAFHEAVKLLMLPVRHDPDGSHGLDRRETLQTVIHSGVLPFRFKQSMAWIEMQENREFLSRRRRGAN